MAKKYWIAAVIGLLLVIAAASPMQPRTVTADVGTGTVLFPESLGVRGHFRANSGIITNNLTVSGALVANIPGALGYSPQFGTLNGTNWAAIAPSTKQNHSATLDAWSAIAPSTKQDASATLSALDALGLGSPGDIIYRGPSGWTILSASGVPDGRVIKKASGFPAWGTDLMGEGGGGGDGDDVHINTVSIPHPNFSDASGYTYSVTDSNVFITLHSALLSLAADPGMFQPSSTTLSNLTGKATTGSGGIVLSNAPTLHAPVVTGDITVDGSTLSESLADKANADDLDDLSDAVVRHTITNTSPINVSTLTLHGPVRMHATSNATANVTVDWNGPRARTVLVTGNLSIVDANRPTSPDFWQVVSLRLVHDGATTNAYPITLSSAFARGGDAIPANLATNAPISLDLRWHGSGIDYIYAVPTP